MVLALLMPKWTLLIGCTTLTRPKLMIGDLAGDFNLIRSIDDRNRPGANLNDIMLFNDLILHLDLLKLGFKVDNSHGVICKIRRY